MGNLLALCTVGEFDDESKSALLKEERVLQVMKISDGKILEFRNPVLVRDLLANHPNSYVGLFKEATQPLPMEYKLKVGKIYYLLPSYSIHAPKNDNNDPSVSTSSCQVNSTKEVQGGGAKRIKVVITKEQLHQLLAKQGDLEDVLSPLGVIQKNNNGVCKADIDEGSSSTWLPKLGSIPEGNELVC